MAATHYLDAGFTVQECGRVLVLTLTSQDKMNRLKRSVVASLTHEIERLSSSAARLPLVICGNPNFSVGADLKEIAQLHGPGALEFALGGQRLMNAIANFPSPVVAAISGYCMGGGLDLALACHYRIASSHAAFGHRGAALGLVTGWGGTQRLPRLLGKARALEMLVAAEKVNAKRALAIGLVDAVSDDPVAEAVRIASAKAGIATTV